MLLSVSFFALFYPLQSNSLRLVGGLDRIIKIESAVNNYVALMHLPKKNKEKKKTKGRKKSAKGSRLQESTGKTNRRLMDISEWQDEGEGNIGHKGNQHDAGTIRFTELTNSPSKSSMTEREAGNDNEEGLGEWIESPMKKRQENGMRQDNHLRYVRGFATIYEEREEEVVTENQGFDGVLACMCFWRLTTKALHPHLECKG